MVLTSIKNTHTILNKITMKKLFYLFIVAMCATMFTACSKDDDTDPFDAGGEGVITMTTDKEFVNLCIQTLKIGEIITIDWGDGQTKEYKSVKIEDGARIAYETKANHTYSQTGTHTIKLTGLVTWLDCGRNQLTTLDVRGCTALESLDCYNNKLTSLDVSENIVLEKLDCGGNELTSLDVSKNTALIVLKCHRNQLTSKALNKIFTDLPKGKLIEHSDYDQSFIDVSDNPGSDTCNKSIAENKGWEVYN